MNNTVLTKKELGRICEKFDSSWGYKWCHGLKITNMAIGNMTSSHPIEIGGILYV